MSAESPRHVRSGGPLTVPSQPPSDRSIIDAVSGFINDVTLSSSSNVDPKDVIQWARFETADINEPTPEGDSDNEISPLLLILGYGSGVQVWLIPPNGEAQEVLSWRQGTVRVLRILPTPQHGDCFASKRPLIALCDSASPGPTFCSLSFISIRGGEQVKSIKFKNQILDVLANKRTVVVSFSERFAVFDAATLEDRMAITTCYPCPCPLGGSMPVNPLALGDRWLAYADKKLNQSKRSSGGCEGEGVTSYTATVLHAAKSLSKGLRGLGESVAHSLAGGRSTSQSPSPPNADIQQPGVVTIIDIEQGTDEEDGQDNEEQCDPIIAHFVAHSEAIIALKFDASGMLLITADRRGHDFHVFRINPHPCGPSLASVHHLYILHRGDTTAKVQDIAISADSRWTAISTLRGTTHVFAISPYGGTCGVRTHTQARVVNRLSRFHRSAGLPIHAHHPKRSSGSPVGDGLSAGAWYPNPRLPPYPQPSTASPLAQLRPTANLPTHTITRTSSGRQRLSSLSEDSSSAPLLARAQFGLYSGSAAAVPTTGGTRAVPPPVGALYLVTADGTLLHLALQPRPPHGVPKEKICDDSPIELHVEGVAQWALQRPAAAADLLAPLPPANPLLRTQHTTKCPDVCMSEEERWLSQVEIVTHAGPHRRLWMGPQFVFKTYNCTGSSSSLSEAETVEVEPGVARSNPVNMPGVRPLVPILIDSGSASSLEHSPSDSFRRKSLLAEGGRAASLSDVQLREDLAEAMKEDHGGSRAEAGEARGAVAREVGPRGRVLPAGAGPAAAPAAGPAADAPATANRDEARFRPVLRAAGLLPAARAPLLRPLPCTTTIPVQPLALTPSPAHRSLSPDFIYTDLENDLYEACSNVNNDIYECSLGDVRNVCVESDAILPLLESAITSETVTASTENHECVSNIATFNKIDTIVDPGPRTNIENLETTRDLKKSDNTEHVTHVETQNVLISKNETNQPNASIDIDSKIEKFESTVQEYSECCVETVKSNLETSNIEEKKSSLAKTLPQKQRGSKRDKHRDKKSDSDAQTKSVSLNKNKIKEPDSKISEYTKHEPSCDKELKADIYENETSCISLTEKSVPSVGTDSETQKNASENKDLSKVISKRDVKSQEKKTTDEKASLSTARVTPRRDLRSQEKLVKTDMSSSQVSASSISDKIDVETTENTKSLVTSKSKVGKISRKTILPTLDQLTKSDEKDRSSDINNSLSSLSSIEKIENVSSETANAYTYKRMREVKPTSLQEPVKREDKRNTTEVKVDISESLMPINLSSEKSATPREVSSSKNKKEGKLDFPKFDNPSKPCPTNENNEKKLSKALREKLDDAAKEVSRRAESEERKSLKFNISSSSTKHTPDSGKGNKEKSSFVEVSAVKPLLPLSTRSVKSVWGQEEIKTEDQAWDMLLVESDKPMSISLPLNAEEALEDVKPKIRRSRKSKRVEETQTKQDEDSFVEIHAIDDKQATTGDLVSISSPFEDVDTSSFLSKSKKGRSSKSLTPETLTDLDQNVNSKKELETNSSFTDNTLSDKHLASKAIGDAKTRTQSNTLIITQSFDSDFEGYKLSSNPVKPRKAKSLSPYPDFIKPVETKDTEVKDVYVIDSSKEEFPDIQITRFHKTHKKVPNAPVSDGKLEEKQSLVDKPIKSWSSVAASKCGKKTDIEAIIELDKKKVDTKNEAESVKYKRAKDLSDISSTSSEMAGTSEGNTLHEKLYELCKRRDIMVAECDAPSELRFIEEHASRDFLPLDLFECGSSDYSVKNYIVQPDLISSQGFSPICKINIDDILSTIKETTSKVIESSSFNLIDLEKMPITKEKGFSVISTHRISSQVVKIDDDVRSNDGEAEMEKSSDDDNISPVVSTDSDKEDRKIGSSKTALPSLTKLTSKTKKSRRKKK